MKFNLKNFYLEVFLKVWDQNLKPNFRSFKWGTCCLCIFDIIGATGNFVKCAGKKRVFLIGTVNYYFHLHVCPSFHTGVRCHTSAFHPITVTAPIMDAACIQKLFFGRWPRLVIKSGFNSKNIFWTWLTTSVLNLPFELPVSD